MDKIITLAQFRNNTEAEVVLTYLRSEGINCQVVGDITNQIFGGYIDMSGAKIEIPQDELPKAIELMKKGGFDKYILENIRII